MAEGKEIIRYPKLELDVPQGAQQVVLHTCCAPCSSAIIECMLEKGIEPVIFYSNPNIYPEEEYFKRKTEITRYARDNNLRIIDDDYDHFRWLEVVKGMENAPEKGIRCLTCFKYRLKRTAEWCSRNHFKVFTTTLASSRWKLLDQINEAGFYAASLFPDTIFWDRNWRKGGLTERRAVLIKENGFYNQKYCGCEFSMNNVVLNRTADKS